MGLRRNIRNAYENVLCPLAKADKSLLPIRMDKTFRRNIELQIDSLARHSLYRDIRVADLSPGQKIGFRTWEDDGREWREAELECCALERLISAKNSEVEHEIYRKHACLRVLQSRHVQTVDCGNGKKTFYARKSQGDLPVMRRRGHAQQSAGSLRILWRKDSNGFLRLADPRFLRSTSISGTISESFCCCSGA